MPLPRKDQAARTKGARSYRRMTVDDRRAELLERGTALFTEHEYGDLTMSKIAKAAGVSKPLLYHYFPTKQAFFLATVSAATEELAGKVRPRQDIPLGDAAVEALGAYLEWIDERPLAFRRLLTAAAAEPGVREILAGVRNDTVARIADSLGHPDVHAAPPALRAALHGWLLFIDGAILVRLDLGAPTREALVEQLLGTLAGAILAAGDETAAAKLLEADPVGDLAG
ncbi:TetR/AcrR family transcriptional regulator [Patulibacter minatonensis]|uniref:TetR/AcrR family transcriptional regulator n=1 Tax=Patulibacter minatonensis TaxID=298163 RepID=UPI00047D0901|nr:TetR/AcrR family transcriptional regulator [Patulibacter minatonensis]